MGNLWQDLRYAVRVLGKNPGFTAVAVITLALGIGANTAIFSIVNGVLLRSFPYRDPTQLAFVRNSQPSGRNFGASPPDFRTLREQNRSFDNLSAFYDADLNLTGALQPEQLSAEIVSSEFFSTLGIEPTIGRTFLPSEEQWGEHRVVILSEPFWRTHFAANHDLSGLTLRLNGERYSVIGVLPASFHFFFHDKQIWLPMAWAPGEVVNSHNSYFLTMVGRLKRGISQRQAYADLNSIMAAIADRFPENKGIGTNLQPLQESVVHDVRPVLLALQGAVGFLLLIACVNLANLVMARCVGRRKETVIRVALGASTARLARQFITESLLLSILGAIAGLMVAELSLHLLPLAASSLPKVYDIQMSKPVIGFALGLSVLTGVLVGLIPALQSGVRDLNSSLKEGGRTSAVGKRGLQVRGALVICEVGLSLVLLVGAALMLQSFQRLIHVNAGFDTSHVLTFEVDLPNSIQQGADAWANGAPAAQMNFFNQLLSSIASIRGVEAVGTTSRLPLQGETWTKRITFGDRPLPASIDAVTQIQYRSVYGEYFHSLGIRLSSGRFVTEKDDANAPQVVVLNKAAAKRYWPNQNPLGKTVLMGPPLSLLPPELLKGMPKNYRSPWSTVVGVVDDVHYGALSADPEPVIYASMAQGDSLLWNSVTVRTKGDPAAIISSVRAALWQINRELPMADIATMQQIWSDSIAQPQLESLLFGSFGALGLLLAVIGTYGVVSYATTLRTNEIGIRMALGAQRADVVKMVLGHGLKLVAAGVAIGVGLSLVLTKFLQNLLYGIKATDPLTVVGVAICLICVGLLAAYIPARRAARIEPMVALRYE